jgi:SAM-dependent methyltransferase
MLGSGLGIEGVHPLGPRPRGTIFDEDAALYDARRPTYPAILIDELARVGELDAGSRVLEIGAGTGQATIALAERGYRLTALEPGSAMAAILERKLRPFRLADVQVETFEAWPLPSEPFDAIVAATSFHWPDPDRRLSKAADALHLGGILAVISTHHVAGGDRSFFEDVQSCYERFDPSTPPGLTLPREDEIDVGIDGIDGSTSFEVASSTRIGRELTYTTQDYRDLLLTYSGHRALDPPARQALLTCIARLLDERFGGRITKRYLFQLVMARKTSR